MKIIPAQDVAQIKQLLASVDLPTDDIDEGSSACFYFIENQSETVALIGLECFDHEALVRSLMVKPDYRAQGLGRQLVKYIEQKAHQLGITHLYLLTTTASPFFEQLGFQIIERKQTPETIRRTEEFSHICPANATLMRKRLNG
ncbi:MAG: arsenic resistance N-acetyltransferase ArsN2 [Sedimenticola sp.]|nr:arsenic resistance N-acetyltransferase ArsN2 [Sedimenticola sp.]